MRRLLCLLSFPLLAAVPHFTVRDAIQAEWARQPLVWTETQKAALPPADRARLDLSIQRIGAPGAPALLPLELEKPTVEAWETKAKAARTPQERFTAVFFLNRLKSPKALTALEGLAPSDAATWPSHLHLEASLATARLNGAEVSPALQPFLDALQKAGKVEPVRAQAARLRLVMAGKEEELFPPVKATPGSALALLDAWNAAPWESRRVRHLALWNGVSQVDGEGSFQVGSRGSLRGQPTGSSSGLRSGTKGSPSDGFMAMPMTSLRKLNLSQLGLGPLRLWGDASRWAIWSRLWDGIPEDAVIPPERWPSHCPEFPRTIAIHWAPKAPLRPFKDPLERDRYLDALEGIRDPILSSVQLPAVRKVSTTRADRLRSRLLEGKDPVAHAAAIDDLPSVPADLKALTHTVWTDAPLDSQQTLIQSYSRWKMAPGEQKAQLVPWLKHPDWACRFEAYQALVKLDPATPWPSAPMPTPTDEAIIVEAVRLTGSGKPVRMRITFASATRTSRSLVLGLDPLAAPMNVANLVLLARKGYFDGHLVPRVVPDFVVQMGSPCDTMDGGPGYTLRCENTLAWYGPGSVGMALSGKDTGGSQFFITTNAAPHLTGKYTRLGEVEDLDRALKLLDDLELGAKIESIKVLEQ